MTTTHTENASQYQDEVFVFPASFAQQRLWFLDQLEPGLAFYNIPCAVRLTGALDVMALEQSVNEIVRRHESLRTTFASKNGQPVQVISPALTLPMPIEDLRNQSEAEREKEVHRLITGEAMRPFDLKHGPLIRIHLLKLGKDDHVALMIMHHIISDGWSMGVFINEMATLYNAFSSGQASPLPELVIQYADFAYWQRQWLQNEVLTAQISYWQQQLAGDLPTLEMPTDRPRPAMQTFRGAVESIKIPINLSKSVKELSQGEGVSDFMTLLAAFQTLLYRYTGQEDICIGSPIANRNRAEIEGLIGFFVNTLVFRTDLTGEPTFRELLKRVRKVTLEGYDHQDLPFEMIVEAVQPERTMSSNPLFQAMFILQNAAIKSQELPGLTLSMLDAETGTSTFDLTLSMAEQADGFDASIEYSTDLFDAPTMERFLAHFQVLLKGIVADPDQPISGLPLLTSDEKNQLLIEWNNTKRSYPLADKCIHQLFEAQTELSPESSAVVFPATDKGSRVQLTYQELNQRANKLAHHLMKLGVGPETVVGICLQRSLEMIVAVLGVIKAGGAYLALDPLYPEDRLAFLMEDSQAKVLLTQAQLLDHLPIQNSKFKIQNLQVLLLDSDWPKIARETQSNPPVRSKPENLAYLVYTSGSTGKPKGVLVQQRSLVNAYFAWKEAYQLDSAGVHLQMASFAFDVFSGDLVRGLCSGGTLVLCPRDYLLEPHRLFELMLVENVDCAEFVPAVLRILVNYLDETQQDFAFMRLLICGSDIWNVRDYKYFQRFTGPKTRLINSFGLAEATIDSSYFEAQKLLLPADRLVPIGRPFNNTQLYVLDKKLQPLPIGVPGELYVGGAGVAGGYLNDPELTRERFITDPFSGELGAKLYKTGDLARFLADGNIEFLGRMDHQVKIRGLRIETGEIESVLKQYPGVKESVVTAVSMPNDNDNLESTVVERLAAYLVTNLAVERIPFEAKCLVRESNNGGRSPEEISEIELNTADLSPGGVCLTGVPETWQVGQDLDLSLNLPLATEALTVVGTVVWLASNQAGIHFEPTPAQQVLLRRSIESVTEPEGWFGAERQVQTRVSYQGTCFLELDKSCVQNAAIESISRGTVRLNAEKVELKRGQNIHIGLELPDNSNPIWLDGSVLWLRDGHVGIKFDTTPEQRDTISRSVEAIIKSRQFSIGDLQAFLKEKLPGYMVPSAFVLLERLPLSPNGKVDRQALPLPHSAARNWQDEYIAPRTPIEEMLSSLWGELLGGEKVGVKDNFFLLGGHSLLATQLISRVRSAFNIELPLRAIFESPSLENFAEQVEIATRTKSSVQAPPMLPVSRDEELPLSFAQQRLWFLDQLEPNSPYYNLPETVRISGPLDLPVLEKCLNAIIQRHEALRTVFKTIDGKPVQVILPNLEIALELVDLRHLDKSQREQEALKWVQEAAQKPFDLTQSPLFRAQVLHMAQYEQIIVLILHHIIGDEWSSNVLMQEIALLYDAFSKGQSSPLQELPIQYADFAHWQRKWLQGKVLKSQIDYWKKHLSGLPPLLELPTDRPRSSVQTYSGHYRTFVLAEDLSHKIKDLCRQEGVTMFMVLLAAFQTLLYRYTRQADICVGTPIANRNRAEIEGLIGFFVNTLALRTDLSGEPTFCEVLKRVRETALGAYAHQDLPFEMIVDALQPERNMSHSPLFQVMFTLQSSQTQPQPRSASELSLSPVEAHSGTAKFDLTLFMVEEEDRLSGAWEYNTDLFDHTTIERIINHFETLLRGVVSEPDARISQLPLLTEAERRQLEIEWNDTEFSYSQDKCVHELFETQAECTPDAVAVTYLDQSLTYAQLNNQANQLGHYLQKQGIGPDTLVGLCVNRSVEMLVGLLGILKAGGAYVPLDPGYPPERLAYMVEDSQIQVLLTQQHLLEHLPDAMRHAPCAALLLDADWQTIAQESCEDLISEVTPDNLVYVIYTSGSTGRPKGTMIRHSGLVNYLAWTQQAYPLEVGRGSPVHSSISFDLTVTSLLAALMVGREVILLSEDQGVEALGEALQRESDFSLIKITPAHLQLLGEQLSPQHAAGCTRAFIIGGENLTMDQIAFWQAAAPETVLVNEYGPTETVVGCCVYWTPLSKHRQGVIPIGRSIINTQLYILDAHLQPVPVGVAGELHIGGTGVARGYLNRPDLTAEKFIPDPFSSDPGARLYKTGDLVRYLPDGNMECLGRIDYQVKIRGFRVELGEIEAALNRHPGVGDAVVWIHEDGGRKQLVAYLVGQDRQAVPSAAEFRDYLGKELPVYMVPTAFVELDALPLTSNGKVDRKALPAPDQNRLELEATFVAPRNQKEQILADIWIQLLGVEQVGVHDNFFELGGDSIITIQVVSRAKTAGIRLTPRQIFEFPTIAGLATVADTGQMSQAEQGIVTGAVPLTPIQHWFFEHNLPKPQHWNQAMLLEAHLPLDKVNLTAALQQVLIHHDALRLRFNRNESDWEQFNSPSNDNVPLEWIDLSALPKEEQKEKVESLCTNSQSSLNLSQGPLLQVAYFDLGENQPARILMVFNHLVIDGVSWRILLEDLQAAYQQISQNQPVHLPPKTTPFRDWAHQLVEHAQSDTVREELDYWLSVSNGQRKQLPVDYSTGDNSEASARSVTANLTEAETIALLQNVPRAYEVNINTALLAALGQAIGRWSGTRSVLVHVEGHGREDIFDHIDISRTVGWFTALYPVRLNLIDSQSPKEILKRVKAQLQSIPQRGLGYGLLRYLSEEEANRKKLQDLPQAEVSFNYLGQWDQALDQATAFELAGESRGPDRCLIGTRTHLLDINGGVAGGRFQVEWTYSENLHRRSTIENVAENFISVLRDIIENSRSKEDCGYTPDDFVDFGWSQEDINDIVSEIGELE